jgi:histidinol phosphatase-like PHP family hydrolase
MDKLYVMIPANHFHMTGFTVPSDLRDQGPKAVRELLYRRFMETVELGFGTGIVHPFIPLGFMDWEKEILSGFTPARYETCFTAAASAGIGIEIQGAVLESKADTNERGFSNLYRDMFSAARECNCKFFFGSDAHTPEKIKKGLYDRLGQFAGLCGIDESMFLEL